MQTPIADFVRNYYQGDFARFHMPGHKGTTFLGCEALDITEVHGADALYEASGIIAESEQNATALFDSGRTLYSTEGSSQCIRAMLYLALLHYREHCPATRPVVLAARNVHKAFIYAAALLDFDVIWLWPKEASQSLCSCPVTVKEVECELKKLSVPPMAVYLTSPDYLGGQVDLKEIAEICHQYGVILAVDNAHGAYLHFLEESQHPLDMGADICCDSAHKTLPVLTGGAYLQISRRAPEIFREQAKAALALFGSTSPSYLTLMSLDLCNRYLADGYREKLADTIEKLQKLRRELMENGWQTGESDPLRLTIRMPEGRTGWQMAEHLRAHQVECEYADGEFVVFMATPENTPEDFVRIREALGKNRELYLIQAAIPVMRTKAMCSIREAVFRPCETIAADSALGRICASPTVSCPPAIPVAVPGEMITEDALQLFLHYGIETVHVVK